MKVFYDWEFYEDGRIIIPISVGLACTDGRELYLINADAPYTLVKEQPWLRANVLPHLPLFWDGDDGVWIDRTKPEVVSRNVLAHYLKAFLQATPDLELWGYYSAYDHVCLAQLWGPMTSLPEGIPMWTNDLQQEIDHWKRSRTPLPALPPQVDEHHALSDAKWIMNAWHTIESAGRLLQ